jgi:hypothetical protein
LEVAAWSSRLDGAATCVSVPTPHPGVLPDTNMWAPVDMLLCTSFQEKKMCARGSELLGIGRLINKVLM